MGKLSASPLGLSLGPSIALMFAIVEGWDSEAASCAKLIKGEDEYLLPLGKAKPVLSSDWSRESYSDLTKGWA